MPHGAVASSRRPVDSLDDIPLKVCHAGQAAGAAVAALALGYLSVQLTDGAAAAVLSAAVCAGTQSLAQLAAQVLGATAGATAISGIDGRTILADCMGEQLPGPLPSLGPGVAVRQLGIRFVGAVAGAALAWVALPPGLDFSLAASAVLASVGAVFAVIFMEASSGAGSQLDTVDDAGPHVKTAELQRLPVVAAVVVGGRAFEGDHEADLP